MDVTLLLIIGGAIIVGLAAYATHLLLKLRKQTRLFAQQQQIAIEQRNAKIFESVEVLCLAAIQGQCDLSEASIRLCYILDHVQGEQRFEVEQQFPALYELFQIVEPMARGEARDALPKQQRMQQNLTRHQAEARLQQRIMTELEQLKAQLPNLNTQIPLQMVQ